MNDHSATGAPARLEVRRRQMLAEQEELARLERDEAKRLHSTRSRLDSVTTKLEALPPARISPEAALAHVLQQMQQCP